MFFVGGMPKSGTTWLRLLLDSHPEISCRGEGHFFNSLAPRLKAALIGHNQFVARKGQTIFPNMDQYPAFNTAHLDRLLTMAIAMMMNHAGGSAPIVGEKTPDNVLWFHSLANLFPAARFVAIVRDGRDCVVSAWFHNLRLNPAKLRATFPDFAGFAATVAKDWTKSVEAGETFAAENPTRCLTVTYEALVRSPEAELSKVLAFLGADIGQDTVRRCVEASSFANQTNGRAPGQEDRSSLFRLGLPGDWRRHFDEASVAAFDAHGGAALRRWGYAAEA